MLLIYDSFRNQNLFNVKKLLNEISVNKYEWMQRQVSGDKKNTLAWQGYSMT